MMQPALTPTLAQIHQASKERRARMGASFKRVAPVTWRIDNVVEFKEPEQTDADRMADWVKRQIEKNKPLQKPNDGPRPSVRAIMRAVAAHYNVRMGDIMGACRVHPIVIPRQVAAYLSKELTKLSLPEIGLHMGGRDHTTILHSHRKIERLIATDPAFKATIDGIKAAIR